MTALFAVLRTVQEAKHRKSSMDVIQVPLSRGLFTTVDAEHFETLKRYTRRDGQSIEVVPSKVKWVAVKNRNFYYAAANIGKFAAVQLHRVIVEAPADKLVDHRNGNSLLNTIANLRICTSRQNTANQFNGRKRVSRFRGVTKSHQKWHASLGFRVDGKFTRIHGGYFLDEEEAGRDYDRLALIYQGEFSRLNFPLPTT